ncbi:MAG: hypothetical protein DRP45_11245 [Candidatus Zixiibacteriota bacterium]|nr:MAG: hypothetical protein DRP45_11245 [candidate division Zixibacteria bacterium]
MRREVPLLITGIVGIVFVVSYFIPHYPFSEMEHWFSDWFAIVAACAIVLGALNLMVVSGQKIARRKEGWGYAIVIIATFLLMTIFGLAGGTGFRETGTGFDWLYKYTFIPLSATMYAILAFFVASASYRAFRARNAEATLLLAAAFLMMLGRVPVGDVITCFMPEGARMSDLAIWIMNFPQTAGQRAIMIGIALGLVSTSLRIILGVERSYLGGE